MKIKKIISSFLLLAVVFTSLVVAFPISASAAYSSEGVSTGTTATANLAGEDLKSYLGSYIAYNYSTAEEMLNDELEAGYLYSVNSADNLYSLYVNQYTGFVYYKNNVTGQILTSNPVDPGYLNAGGSIAVQDTARKNLMSQIEIKFYETENATIPKTYNSYDWAALRAQISVSPIANGLRVNYILGDTTPRFLLPGAITVEKFDQNILTPLINAYVSILTEVCLEKGYDEDFEFDFFENEDYSPYDEFGYINVLDDGGILDFVSDTNKIALKACGNSTASKEYKSVSELGSAVSKMARAYSMENPEYYNKDSDLYTAMVEKYPIFGEGVAIYICNVAIDNTTTRRQLGNYIKTYCPDYTFAMMYADEKECNYVNEVVQKPVFRCALEYSFNSDHSLSVSLPASSITFDETVYTLEYIRPLQFFGCADAANAGYIFFPDGSGTIVDFKDFYRPGSSTNPNLSLSTSIYGTDYAYSAIDLKNAYRQQVTMPVYGVVNEVSANATTSALYGKETVTNGYFAILEEGSSLATLWINSDFPSYKYGTVFASYSPYPIDTFDLSESSTSETGIFKLVSPFKYTGSYSTRFVMLTDDEIGNAVYGEDAYYESSYVGMAAYYKNYLKNNGTLATLEMVSDNLPLYIEALGAMDITAKILSFPVTKSVPLTSFEDIITMQNELANAKDLALAKAAENEQLAAATEDAELKASYTALANEYREFAALAQNITNINVRLTGFANGGVKSTYPTKSRWERACGGSEGYEALLAEADKVSANAGMNFSVYADFDFMYINNTAMFDGIRNKGNVSKMIDNRYASMQLYNSSLREFESLFDLVVSSDVLDKFYTKFEKSFSESGSNKLSVSTLGAALNSNFDEDNYISRESAMSDVDALLSRMTAIDGYELMLDAGNVYTLKYATHLLNVATDSSHFRYSSYTVPFTGLVLHSFVSYAGSPLNYSGNVQYEILKSIENGAAPYYILCYQNTANLKEDEELNDYYGVSYQNWYNDIVTTYAVLNDAIGSLQDYEIYDHDIIVCERVIEDSEMQANYVLLQNEIVELLSEQLKVLVDEAYASLKEGGEENYAKRLKLNINRDALMNQFSEILNLPVSEFSSEFVSAVDAIISAYTLEYAGAELEENSFVVSFDKIDYVSKYSYITDSAAFDKDYVRTDYTIDNGNVTMVTYRKGNDKVSFLINYNNFSVTIRLDADTVITLDKLSFKKLG